MTTTRIDHTGHNHPNTTAARTACRKAINAGTAPSQMVTADSYINNYRRITGTVAPVVEVRVTDCTIDLPHCENCGSTNRYDLTTGDQGYTACCNELISDNSFDCRNHHGM
jgi:hypothetical protein